MLRAKVRCEPAPCFTHRPRRFGSFLDVLREMITPAHDHQVLDSPADV